MSRKYPRLMSKKTAKSPGQFGHCVCEDCPELAVIRCEVQETYMRGEDEYYRLCQKHYDEWSKKWIAA